MIQKKHSGSFCLFVTALLFFMAGRAECSTDSFWNMPKNSYSLSQTFDRFFLQSIPVPQVWQTNPASPEFKQAMPEFFLPETREERLFKAILWENEQSDIEKVFQELVIEDQASEKGIVADMLEDMVPIVFEANDNAVEETDEIDSLFYARLINGFRKEVPESLYHAMDIQYFIQALNEITQLDVDMEILEKHINKTDTQRNLVLAETKDTFLPENILEKAEDVESMETMDISEMKDVDDVFLSLLVNDLYDLSVGSNFLFHDDLKQMAKKEESTNRSVSLLDRIEKTYQIQEDTFAAEREALMKRLTKRLNVRSWERR